VVCNMRRSRNQFKESLTIALYRHHQHNPKELDFELDRKVYAFCQQLLGWRLCALPNKSQFLVRFCMYDNESLLKENVIAHFPSKAQNCYPITEFDSSSE